MRLKRFSGKGKQKTMETTQNLGSDSGDEALITTMGVKGTLSVNDSSDSITSTSYLNELISNEWKRIELFHIIFVIKHTQVETLFDLGSQANLILESLVKKLGLENKPHLSPYLLGSVSDKVKLQVTKQCMSQFVITSKLVDEVELDVVPLDIYGIILGIPYLYDRKEFFFRHGNKYHLTKDGAEYIVRAHHTKVNASLVSAR